MEKGIQKAIKIEPEDISKVFQGGMYLIQGQHDVLPEFMNDAGNLLMKASKKLSTTQLILIVAGLAVVSIFAAKKIEEELED
ncbi:hypothetical protein [Adhaeribacter terreus]|uniref:Uncharacterized protein n=1 Tax=Adhaeribacter terreus TaxID=529703 RepID=A0ABW0EAC6_9BACT